MCTNLPAKRALECSTSFVMADCQHKRSRTWAVSCSGTWPPGSFCNAEQNRHLMQVGASIGRLQEDAKAIKNDLSAAHSQHKSRQTSKILSDFEVTIHSAVSLLIAFQHGIKCLPIRAIAIPASRRAHGHSGGRIRITEKSELNIVLVPIRLASRCCYYARWTG